MVRPISTVVSQATEMSPQIFYNGLGFSVSLVSKQLEKFCAIKKYMRYMLLIRVDIN
jgi:hypothetical protein